MICIAVYIIGNVRVLNNARSASGLILGGAPPRRPLYAWAGYPDRDRRHRAAHGRERPGTCCSVGHLAGRRTPYAEPPHARGGQVRNAGWARHRILTAELRILVRVIVLPSPSPSTPSSSTSSSPSSSSPSFTDDHRGCSFLADLERAGLPTVVGDVPAPAVAAGRTGEPLTPGALTGETERGSVA